MLKAPRFGHSTADTSEHVLGRLGVDCDLPLDLHGGYSALVVRHEEDDEKPLAKGHVRMCHDGSREYRYLFATARTLIAGTVGYVRIMRGAASGTDETIGETHGEEMVLTVPVRLEYLKERIQRRDPVSVLLLDLPLAQARHLRPPYDRTVPSV